jgi:very-short-patch-repair endonuclease
MAKGSVREHKIALPQETINLPTKKEDSKVSLPPRHRMTEGVRALWCQIVYGKLPTPVLEHRFHPERKWRFDLAWPDRKLAVEVEGGVYANGRHNRGKGYENDAVKYNQAQLLGWRVLRYSTGQAKKIALADLRRALEWQEAPQ